MSDPIREIRERFMRTLPQHPLGRDVGRMSLDDFRRLIQEIGRLKEGRK